MAKSGWQHIHEEGNIVERGLIVLIKLSRLIKEEIGNLE